jgi:CRISPR-associated protein Cas1
LRSAVARSLAGSGLLATFGIHHHNRYNAFCLADDMMEPYRPYVDELVYRMYEKWPDQLEIETEHKAELLQLMTTDVRIGENRRPLMVALSQTTASLARCFSGEERKLVLPVFE